MDDGTDAAPIIDRLVRVQLTTLQIETIVELPELSYFGPGVFVAGGRLYWSEQSETAISIRSRELAGGEIRTELVQLFDPDTINQDVASLGGVLSDGRLLLARVGSGEGNPLGLALEYTAELRAADGATTSVYAYRGSGFRLPWYFFGLNIVRPVSAYGDSILWRDGFTGEWMLRNAAGATTSVEPF